MGGADSKRDREFPPNARRRPLFGGCTDRVGTFYSAGVTRSDERILPPSAALVGTGTWVDRSCREHSGEELR